MTGKSWLQNHRLGWRFFNWNWKEDGRAHRSGHRQSNEYSMRVGEAGSAWGREGMSAAKRGFLISIFISAALVAALHSHLVSFFGRLGQRPAASIKTGRIINSRTDLAHIWILIGSEEVKNRGGSQRNKLSIE
jgi:hypothetical protein